MARSRRAWCAAGAGPPYGEGQAPSHCGARFSSCQPALGQMLCGARCSSDLGCTSLWSCLWRRISVTQLRPAFGCACTYEPTQPMCMPTCWLAMHCCCCAAAAAFLPLCSLVDAGSLLPCPPVVPPLLPPVPPFRQVGMAQTRRASQRKAGAGVDDTDIVEDVEGIEEDLEQEEEDGIKLEAFNLKVCACVHLCMYGWMDASLRVCGGWGDWGAEDLKRASSGRPFNVQVGSVGWVRGRPGGQGEEGAYQAWKLLGLPMGSTDGSNRVASGLYWWFRPY